MNNINETKQKLTLKCIVTGAERPTSEQYLQTKANRTSSNVQEIVTNYVSRDTLKEIRQTVRAGGTEYKGLSLNTLQTILRLNGKQKHAAVAV